MISKYINWSEKAPIWKVYLFNFITFFIITFVIGILIDFLIGTDISMPILGNFVISIVIASMFAVMPAHIEVHSRRMKVILGACEKFRERYENIETKEEMDVLIGDINAYESNHIHLNETLLMISAKYKYLK